MIARLLIQFVTFGSTKSPLSCSGFIAPSRAVSFAPFNRFHDPLINPQRQMLPFIARTYPGPKGAGSSRATPTGHDHAQVQ
jgi:hypothetical protein